MLKLWQWTEVDSLVDYADKYYAKIRGNERKGYTKCHITIDVESGIILHSQALKGPKHDINFAIPSARAIKKYHPDYILADKAYDVEKFRNCINKEINAKEQIPLKKNFAHGWFRRLSKKSFKKEIYSQRSQVERVFSVIKRLLSGINRSRSVRLQNKETRLKTTIYNIIQFIKISS